MLEKLEVVSRVDGGLIKVKNSSGEQRLVYSDVSCSPGAAVLVDGNTVLRKIKKEKRRVYNV